MTQKEKHEFLLKLYRNYDEGAEYLITIKVLGDFVIDFLYPIEADLEEYFDNGDEFADYFDDDKPTLIDKLDSFKDKTIRWLEDVPYHLQLVKEYKHRKKHKLSRRDSYMFSVNFYSLIRENLNYILKELEDYYDMSYGDASQQVIDIQYAMELCTALEFLDEHADTFITTCLHPEYPQNFFFENCMSEKEWKELNIQLRTTLRNKFADLFKIIREAII
jgi:hypothetical protein